VAAVAVAAPHTRGDDFVNTPPGCTEMLQQKRKCAPPCPQETM
jgi:hypothetical protein